MIPLPEPSEGRVDFYDTVDPFLQREVTICWLREIPEETQGRLLEFLRSWGNLRDRRIERLYEVAFKGKDLKVIMDRRQGSDLESLLGQSPAAESFGAAGLRHMVEEVTCALGYAHEQGLVHGAIHPQQIRFEADESVKIQAFTREEMLMRLGATNLLTSTSAFASYLAPEWVRGETKTPAVDVYGLGTLLHFWISRQSLFPADAMIAVMKKTLSAPPPSLDLSKFPEEAYPQNLSDVVARCLAKDATDRYATVQEVADALYPDLGLRKRNLDPVSELIVRGCSALSGGRHEKALAIFFTGFDIDPTNGIVSNNMGVALCHLQRFEGARDAFRRAVKNLSDPRVSLANLEWLEGSRDFENPPRWLDQDGRAVDSTER